MSCSYDCPIISSRNSTLKPLLNKDLLLFHFFFYTLFIFCISVYTELWLWTSCLFTCMPIRISTMVAWSSSSYFFRGGTSNLRCRLRFYLVQSLITCLVSFVFFIYAVFTSKLPRVGTISQAIFTAPSTCRLVPKVAIMISCGCYLLESIWMLPEEVTIAQNFPRLLFLQKLFLKWELKASITNNSLQQNTK